MTSRSRWERVSTSLACILGLLACLAVVWLGGVRINLTGSLPVGLYRVTETRPVRGAIVLVCLPPGVADFARDRGYVPRGGSCAGGMAPVGKPVFALPGDVVTVTPAALLLNGVPAVNSKPLPADRHGRPLPRLRTGRHVVRAGELWLLSGYSRFSFDSRYFGAVPAANIRARVELVRIPPGAGPAH